MKTYFIVNTCIFNSEEEDDLRDQQYKNGISKLIELTKDMVDIKIIIVENNGNRKKYLDEYNNLEICSVFHTSNNRNIETGNIGIKELIDIFDCIKLHNIDDEDFVVKLNGRYVLNDDSEFITALKNSIVSMKQLIKPITVVEQEQESTPITVTEQEQESTPIAEQEQESTPVTEQEQEPITVAEQESTPVTEQEQESTPITVAEQEESTPITVAEQEQEPQYEIIPPPMASSDIRCILRYGSYDSPVDYKTEECITGIIGMKCKDVKQISIPRMEEKVENCWSRVTNNIDDTKVMLLNKLGLNVCPGGNDYFLV